MEHVDREGGVRGYEGGLCIKYRGTVYVTNQVYVTGELKCYPLEYSTKFK